MSVKKANTDPEWFYLQHYAADDPFGSYAGRDPNGPGHLGADFNGMPAGTQIPAISNFVVVATGYNKAIGNYAVIRVPDGYMLFYHLLEPSPLVAGESGGYGDLIGLLGNTGTTSAGNHSHVGFSRTSGTAGTGNVEDPWPVIQAYIKANKPKEEISMSAEQNILAALDGVTRRIRAGAFLENTFELEGGPTREVYERGSFDYPNRQAVWASGVPVRITKGGKTIERFVRKAGKSYAKLAGVTDLVPLTANEVARADAQRTNGQSWAAA